MNRVIVSVLSEKNNLRREDIQTLSGLFQSRPLQDMWKSERFGIFPLQVVLYLSNPPFNKISISLPVEYRTRIQILGSGNGKEYTKLQEVNPQQDDFDDFGQGGIVIKYFKKSQRCTYIKLRFHCPTISGMNNLCKQVGLRAIQISNAVYFNCKYLCSLRKRLQIHPVVFRVLELLEYKTLVIEKQKPTRYTVQLKDKYCKRIGEIEDMIHSKKLSPVHPQAEIMAQLGMEFEQLLEQPMLEEEQLDLSNPLELKGRIKALECQLSSFYVDRLMSMQLNISEYFSKYHNQEIRDIYLRLLSSPEDQDRTKALVEFWSEVKQLPEISPNIQQATLMFLNYFMEFISNEKIKLAGMKVLGMFLKCEQIGFKLYNLYARLMHNLLRCLELGYDQEEYKLAYKNIFLMYSKLPHQVFIRQLLLSETQTSIGVKLKKLEILEKIILNDEKFTVDSNDTKQLMVEFLLGLLLTKELTLENKHSAYQVVAFLVQIYGKQNILPSFQKLNSVLLMNMQKTIDKKLSTLPQPVNPGLRCMCDYCGLENPDFQDDNLYDLHCFKQCKMLAACQHCSCIVQIPELNKHYLEQCQLKNKFKNCQGCFDVVLLEKQQEHLTKCSKKPGTKCPLCQQKLQNKLKIKQHLLKDTCPNNPRN